jgi:hypothetical protein
MLENSENILRRRPAGDVEKFCFRPVISISHSYLAIFIRNEISSNDLGLVFQTLEIYKINKHILESM